MEAVLADLSVAQRTAFDEFKAALIKDGPPFPDEGPDSWFQNDDRTIFGFLVARDFHVGKALKMIRDSIESRLKWRPHEIHSKDEDVAKQLKGGAWRMAGLSKKGLPVHLIEVRKFHPRDVESMESFTRLLFFEFETGKLLCKQSNWAVERVVLIYDLTNFSMFDQGSPFGVKYTTQLIHVAQDNFPEHLEQIYLWNSPYLFRAFFAIVKPFLNEKVASKIRFVSDATEFDQLIDPSVRYKAYGGLVEEEYPIPER